MSEVKAKKEPVKIDFKHTIKMNICTAIKRNVGSITRDVLYAHFIDQPFVVDAFVKTLIRRRYLNEYDGQLHLDWLILENLAV